MDSRVGVNQVAQLADLESESSLFKSLLHLAWAKVTEITSVLGRAALTELGGELGKVFTALKGCSNLLDSLDSLLLGPGDLLVSKSVYWVSRSCVLQEDVAASDWGGEVKELDLELECRVWWNHVSSTLGAVGIVGWAG